MCDLLDHLVTGIGNRIDRMTKADHDFLGRDPAPDVGFRLVRVGIALLHLERDLVGPAMLRPAQRADGAGYRRIHVGAGAGDRARGKGRGVELMFGIEVERGMHRAFVRSRRRPAVQQMQEMGADRGVVGLHLDTAAVMGVVVPVQQHRAERGHQAVGDVAGAGRIVVVALRQYAAERRYARAHDVHRMRRRRQLFECVEDRARQAAQRFQLRLVVGELSAGRQAAVDQ